MCTNLFLRLLPLILLVVATACNPVIINYYSSNALITGAGPVVDSTISVADFTGIKLTNEPAVYLSQGATFSVRVSAYKNLLPLVRVVKQGNTLTVGTAENVTIANNNITFSIQLPILEGLESKGTGRIESKTDFVCNMLTTKLTGTGDVLVTGKAQSLNLTLSGTGTALFDGFSKTVPF